MKTYSVRPRDLKPKWHVLDASLKPLGRLAVDVARLLQGKHKVIYSRHINTGDFVVVINASQLRTTGQKLSQKVYVRHSGYVGHQRRTSMTKMLQTHPDRIVIHAVKGMLPKNFLGSTMLKRLRVYAGAEHPHQGQVNAPPKDEKANANGNSTEVE